MTANDRTALREPGRRRIPRVVWEAAEVARRRTREAEAECRAMRERAAADVEAIRAGAAAAGREEGLALVTETLARAARIRDDALAAAERDLVDLSLAVAGRVLARAFERDREAVVEVAARALELARRRSQIVVRASPRDVAALRLAEPRLVERLERVRSFRIVPDDLVETGGVVVETEVGAVDARLASQLDALRRALEGAP